MQLKFMTFLTVRIMWHFSSLCVYLYSQKRGSEKNGGIMAGRQRSEWRKIILPLINYDHLRYHTSVACERAGFSGKENYEKTSQFKREMQRFLWSWRSAKPISSSSRKDEITKSNSHHRHTKERRSFDGEKPSRLIYRHVKQFTIFPLQLNVVTFMIEFTLSLCDDTLIN